MILPIPVHMRHSPYPEVPTTLAVLPRHTGHVRYPPSGVFGARRTTRYSRESSSFDSRSVTQVAAAALVAWLCPNLERADYTLL